MVERADSVLGCAHCGKPVALVGDEVPAQDLCAWCCQKMYPGAYELFLRDFMDLHVSGVSQARDVEKVFGEDFNFKVVGFRPKETHYYLNVSCSQPAGRFTAEVTREDWEHYVLPVFQRRVEKQASLERYARVGMAVANVEAIKKLELYSDPFDAWWALHAADCSCGNTKDALRLAFEAGRKSVLGELDPKDER